MAKKNVYEIVTERILELLDQGVAPWKRAWNFRAGLPQNFDSKRPYRGFNLMYLAFVQMLEGWQYPYFLTYVAARKHGWQVKKGEVGNIVVFFKTYERTETDELTGEERTKKIGVLRYYYVFNLDQIDGWSGEDLPKPAKAVQKIRSCEGLIENFVDGLPPILHGKPAYWPTRDVITLPDLAEFETEERYYASRYHETVHATGAQQRLARPGIVEFDTFGSERYSFEELIAELGAAFLNAMSGISDPVIEQNAAYVQAWRDKLADNPTWIVKASSNAQKAVDYLLAN